MNGALFLLVGVAVAPLLIALHEIGHAVAALRLTDGPVILLVGKQEPRARLAVGPRLTVAVSGGLTRGGSVRHKPAATRRDAAIITAAGPAMTLVTGLIAGVLAFHDYVHGAPRLELYVFAAAAAGSLGMLLFNGGRNVVEQPDGYLQPTDGETLARLAGAKPLTEAPRTSPIAWAMVALAVALSLLIVGVSVTQLAVVAFLAVPLLILGRIAVAERRQRAR